MDVLIESTREFEKDLDRLGHDEKAMVVEKINYCTDLFPIQKTDVYRKLRRLSTFAELNGYESSLYTLKVLPKLRVILSVDEDPIFDQVIFTLFRVVEHDDLHKSYQGIAESLYQEIAHYHSREEAQVS